MKKKLCLLLATSTLATTAHALPTVYPDSSTTTLLSTITNSTNSNLVADNVDQRVIYVMPPTSATSTVGGLHTITTNVGFCHEMADLKNYSKSSLERIEKLQIQETQAKVEADKTRAKLAEARQEMAKYVTLNNLEELENIDDRIIAIEKRLSTLADSYAQCSDLCDDIRNEMKDLRAEKIELTQTRRTLAANKTKELREFNRKKEAVNAYVQSLAEMDKSWVDMSNRIEDMRNRYHDMYNKFAQMEGARASLKFESGWDKNIQTLRDENKGFDFKKIITKNAVITTDIMNVSGIPAQGAILSYDISGESVNGKMTLPAYPENLSGNVRLSLVGTCTALYPNLFIDPQDKPAIESGPMKYGMTVSYEYPSAFSYKVQVKYNMYKMYQKIVSSGSSGGWFSSRSWSSVEEKNFFRDSFEVDWTQQDVVEKISDEFKLKLESDIRNNVLTRLASIALPVVPSAQALIAAPGVPKTGAMVISDSLRKTCPTNVYCVGASIFLDAVQAIFGSGSSSSSYKNIQDAEVKESWSSSQVNYLPWITTYN